jgi:hypothetical protein
LVVLVDESVAVGVSSDRSARPIHDDVAIVGRALPETTVRPTLVVMGDVVVEEPFEVDVVLDERAIEEFAARRADPTFRVGVRDWCARRGADDRRAGAAEHLIEAGDELAATVTDQEPDRAFVAHREVAGGLGRPRAGRILGDPGEVHAAAVKFDEEQHVVATQHDGVDGEEVTRHNPGGLRAEELGPRLRVPTGGGSMPAVLRIVRTVDAAIVMPSRASSPWIRRYPHVGFSWANRRIVARVSTSVEGRPRRCG